MVFIYIVGGFIFLMLVVRPILNTVNKNGSNQNWDRIISEGNIDQMMEKEFGLIDMQFVIVTVLKPYNVNYIKFMSNLLFLKEEGMQSYLPVSDDRKYFSIYTPSIKEYASSLNRPHLPLWYIAAFPDIVLWINSNENGIEMLFPEINEENYENEFSLGADREGISTLKIMVQRYLRLVKPYLEIT